MVGTVCGRRISDSFFVKINKLTTFNAEKENNIKIVLKISLGVRALDSAVSSLL